MIHVLASIQVKPGKRNAFLEIFKTNVPNVLQNIRDIGFEDFQESIPFPGFDLNTG